MTAAVAETAIEASPHWQPELTDPNLAKARAAAAIESQWIASLGDLSAYGLSPRVRQAAELRRDCPQLTYAQLADQMGVTKDTYTGLIRQLRGRVHRRPRPYRRPTIAEEGWARARALAVNEAQWIASLGDLSAYDLSPRVRQAAELRRDHPDLSRAQLAAQMDITMSAYAELLRRLRASLLARPSLPQRITGLGDLSTYDFSPRVQQAAELRRDHPTMSVAQLAAMMGVKPNTYSHYLCLLRYSVGWSAGAALLAVTVQDETGESTAATSPRAIAESQWISGLGDLSTYGIAKRVQRAAELRRDHPGLTQAQLAGQMGISHRTFRDLLYRFRIAVAGGSPRKAPLPRRLDDLKAIAQRIEESVPAPRVSPG